MNTACSGSAAVLDQWECRVPRPLHLSLCRVGYALTAGIYAPLVILAVVHYTTHGWKKASHDRVYRWQGWLAAILAWAAGVIFIPRFTFLVVWANQTTKGAFAGSYLESPEKLVTVQTDFLCNCISLLVLLAVSLGLFSEPGSGD